MKERVNGRRLIILWNSLPQDATEPLNRDRTIHGDLSLAAGHNSNMLPTFTSECM